MSAGIVCFFCSYQLWFIDVSVTMAGMAGAAGNSIAPISIFYAVLKECNMCLHLA